MKSLIAHDLIENKIFIIRGQKVIISTHLAELYGVETRVLIQAVKRNIERFPADFMFSLTRKEIMNLSQFVISSKVKHAPNVYIAIMRAFVKLREIISTHKELAHKLSQLERKIENHDKEIQAIFETIRQLMVIPEKPKRRIGFHSD